MPKLEPKQIQKELEQGLLWPVYWIYGSEEMKSRELLKKIRKTVHGGNSFSLPFSLNEEILQGTEISGDTILDAAQSYTLDGGIRLVIVRDGHAVSEVEKTSELFGPSRPCGELHSVCVFLSKDLDGRKKFSKQLLEKAAVVPCEQVLENEREGWVKYLAEGKKLQLTPVLIFQLSSLEPWSLDIVAQELEKFSIASSAGIVESEIASQVLSRGVGADEKSENFVEAFFQKDLKRALILTESFAAQPEEALPLLGLMGWNLRHLALFLSEKEKGVRSLKLNPYLSEKLARWSKQWSLKQVLKTQVHLQEVDYSIKQTFQDPRGLWSNFLMAVGM